MSPALEAVPAGSIPQAIFARIGNWADEPALLSFSSSAWHALSYVELKSRVTALAAALVSRGVKSGDRLALVGGNSPAWATAYLAIQYAGGIAVPLDRMQAPDEWLDTLERAGAVWVFAATAEGSQLLPRLVGHRSVEHTVWLDREPGDGAAALDDLVAKGQDRDFTPPPVKPDDLAALIFTSGTTGKSKGVMLTHRNIVTDAAAMVDVVGIAAGRDRFLSVLPLHHCYECTCGFVAPLLAGARVYYARSLAPREMLPDLASSQATFLLAVPLLFEKIVGGIERELRRKGGAGRAVEWLWNLSTRGRGLWGHRLGRVLLGSVRKKAGLDSIRFFVSGGAPLPAQVGYALEGLGLRLLQGYGLTETSPVATLNSPTRPNPASVGRALPGVEVHIHDPDSAGKGEIWIRGGTVMAGYWQDPEATAAVLQDGWFKTGDLGYRDASGHLFITGRSKNLIVSPGGKNISPEEIELAVARCPLVAEVVVYGRPVASGGGEEVCAAIYPDLEAARERGLAPEIDGELRDVLRAEIDRLGAELASYKRIVHLEVTLEPLPKTTSQKIKRTAQSRRPGS